MRTLIFSNTPNPPRPPHPQGFTTILRRNLYEDSSAWDIRNAATMKAVQTQNIQLLQSKQRRRGVEDTAAPTEKALTLAVFLDSLRLGDKHSAVEKAKGLFETFASCVKRALDVDVSSTQFGQSSHAMYKGLTTNPNLSEAEERQLLQKYFGRFSDPCWRDLRAAARALHQLQQQHQPPPPAAPLPRDHSLEPVKSEHPLDVDAHTHAAPAAASKQALARGVAGIVKRSEAALACFGSELTVVDPASAPLNGGGDDGDGDYDDDDSGGVGAKPAPVPAPAPAPALVLRDVFEPQRRREAEDDEKLDWYWLRKQCTPLATYSSDGLPMVSEDDLATQLLRTLQSGRASDALQTELLDLLGFEALDLIAKVLKLRDRFRGAKVPDPSELARPVARPVLAAPDVRRNLVGVSITTAAIKDEQRRQSKQERKFARRTQSTAQAGAEAPRQAVDEALLEEQSSVFKEFVSADALMGFEKSKLPEGSTRDMYKGYEEVCTRAI
jgi:hypothetical protein